jgi:hypothetical protein
MLTRPTCPVKFFLVIDLKNVRNGFANAQIAAQKLNFSADFLLRRKI